MRTEAEMTRLMNLISDEEYVKMHRYIINNALPDSYDVPAADIHNILKTWAENKSEYLGSIFKDSLILSRRATYEIEEENLRDIEHLVDTNTFIRKLSRKVSNMRPEWTDHSEEARKQRIICDILESLMYPNTLFENKVSQVMYHSGQNTIEINHPDWTHSIKVQDGMRAMRILGKLARAEHLETEFEEFRNEHAKLANRNSCVGTLCLSIHPLDYMTMSDNASEWHSCMSWKESGCYRQGTVEMMNSPMVVVAYLRDEENDMNLFNLRQTAPDNQWNNKKWRSLFIVTPEMITDVKSYPYFNSHLTKTALAWLTELVEAASGVSYTNNITEYTPFENFENPVSHNLHDRICVSPSTRMMYNDFSSGRTNFAVFSPFINKDTHLRFNYSGPSQCMCCGQTLASFTSEEYLVCEDCDGTDAVYCAECGCRIDLREEDYEELNGEYYCRCCFEDVTCCDDLTGEVVLISNTVPVFMADGDTIYPYIACRISRENLSDSYTMRHANLATKMTRHFNQWIAEMGMDVRSYITIDIKDITDEGAGLFGFRSIEELQRRLQWQETVEAVTPCYSCEAIDWRHFSLGRLNFLVDKNDPHYSVYNHIVCSWEVYVDDVRICDKPYSVTIHNDTALHEKLLKDTHEQIVHSVETNNMGGFYWKLGPTVIENN